MRIQATECDRCGSRWYPARDVCATCRNTPLQPLLAGPAATVYAATTVWAGAPGFTVPYSLAYLDVDGLRVLAHLEMPGDSSAQPGTRVLLRDGAAEGLTAVLVEEGSGGDA